jgi:hypothetical protein
MTSELVARIRAVIAPPADELLSKFFNPQEPFAGDTCDSLPDNPRNSFSVSDLLAETFLDVVFEPRAVRALLRPNFSRHLADVPDNVDLWSATEEDLQPAYWLRDEVIALNGVGRVKTSKLLARKRPRLIPIVDSVARNTLGMVEGQDDWEALRDALQDAQLRDGIEAIRPPGLALHVTTLRLLDAATWMRGSRSRNAKVARKAVGLSN